MGKSSRKLINNGNRTEWSPIQSSIKHFNFFYNLCHKQSCCCCFFFLEKISKSNIKLLLCLHSLLLTLKELGEFLKVLQTLKIVTGWNDRLIFSQYPLLFISGCANVDNVSFFLHIRNGFNNHRPV